MLKFIDAIKSSPHSQCEPKIGAMKAMKMDEAM